MINKLKYLLVVLLIGTITTINAQETTYTKIDKACAWDNNLQEWSTPTSVNGLMVTTGNKVRIAVEYPELDIELNLTYVDKAENDESLLVKYYDVIEDIYLWYYYDKVNDTTILKLTGQGASVQFRLVNSK